MNYQGIYTNEAAYKVCTVLYGKVIHTNTWASWKNVIKKKRRRYLSEDEFMVLCAIAHLRKSIPKRKLSFNEVEETIPLIACIVKKIITQPKVYVLQDPSVDEVKRKAKKQVQGKEIQNYLRKKGINPPSLSTLRRRIAGFSMEEYYPIRTVLAAAKQKNRELKAS